MAAILSGQYQKEAEAFGLALGALFQLTDDILDAVGIVPRSESRSERMHRKEN